jgi:hypothetical protein
MRVILYISLVCFLTMACKSKSTTVEQGTSVKMETSVKENNDFEVDPLEESRDCVPLILGQNDESKRDLVQPTVQKAYIKEACLYLTFEYSGCKKEAVRVSWDKVIQKGTFPKVDLLLTVKNPGLCESIINDMYSVDLSELGTVGSKVLITINGKEQQIPMVQF